jgi:uncharacterized protein
VRRKVATVVWMLDVSGSMGKDNFDLARADIAAVRKLFRARKRPCRERFVLFDVYAREVSKKEFSAVAHGTLGTRVSKALTSCERIILREGRGAQELCVVLFSDGDNWSLEDTLTSIDIIRERLLPRVTLFAYAQLAMPYGKGALLGDLGSAFAHEPRVLLVELRRRDDFAQAFVQGLDVLRRPVRKAVE